MANRRGLHALIRHGSVLSSSVHRPLRTLPQLHSLARYNSLLPKTPFPRGRLFLDPIREDTHFSCFRRFLSGGRDDDFDDSDDFDDVDDEGEDDGDDEEEGYDEWEEEEEEEVTKVPKFDAKKYSEEMMKKESAAIGYKNLGPLDLKQKPFKPYEPVFAIVQVFILCIFVDMYLQHQHW